MRLLVVRALSRSFPGDEKWISPGVTSKKRDSCAGTKSYRIQNCFSTISPKILVIHYYFRDFWRTPWCIFLRITYIFAIESDIFVALIVVVLSAMPIAISGELPGPFFCESLIFSP